VIMRIMIVRGVCDYCDNHKNDQWQSYAALAAASIACFLLRPIMRNRKELSAEKRVLSQ